MPSAPAQAAAEGLPIDHPIPLRPIKLLDVEDAIGEAQHFIQAIFMAANGLASKEDRNAIAIVANEAAERLTDACDLIDILKREHAHVLDA
jgi:hypothetical protein